MQRHTNELARWTGFNHWALTSCTAFAMLICSSVGCVSWKHNLRKHSWCAKMAQKFDGRYYHCSHCGQIIPQEGGQCSGCFKVPAYHGYAATCWRTFPEGWGCLPETAANNPTLLQTGMLETDQPVLAAPESDSDNKEKDSDDEAKDSDDKDESDDAVDIDVQEVAPPIPDTEPNNSEVQNTRLPNDRSLAQVEESIVMPTPIEGVLVSVVEPTAEQEVTAASSTPSSVTNIPMVSRSPLPAFTVALDNEPATDGLADSSSEAKSTDQQVQLINPQDEFGPIPVRRVRLSDLENSATAPGDLRTVSDRTITNVKKHLAKPSTLNSLHPTPVRRIPLSEFPVSIE